MGFSLGDIFKPATDIIGGFMNYKNAKQTGNAYDQIQLGSYGALSDANKKNLDAVIGRTVTDRVRRRDPKTGRSVLGKNGKAVYDDVKRRIPGYGERITNTGINTAQDIQRIGLGSLGRQQDALTQGEIEAANAGEYGLNQSRSALLGGLDKNRQMIGSQYNAQQSALDNIYNPYLESGRDAQSALSDLTGLNGQQVQNEALTSSPAYQFRLGEGTNAIQRSAAARGGLFGGATGKALSDFGQGLASEEFGNQWNRVNDMATRGQGMAQGYSNVQQNLLGNKYQGYMGNTADKSNMLSQFYTNRAGIRSNEQQKLAEIMARMEQERGNLNTGTRQQIGGLRAGRLTGELQAKTGFNTNKGQIDYNLYQALGRGTMKEMGDKDAAQGQMFQGGMGLLTNAANAYMGGFGGGTPTMTPNSPMMPQNSPMMPQQQGFGQQVALPYYQQQNYGMGFYG